MRREFMDALYSEKGDLYIPAQDKHEQKSLTLSLNHSKRKLNTKIQEILGISSEVISGRLYVKVFRTEPTRTFTMVDGKLVPTE